MQNSIFLIFLHYFIKNIVHNRMTLVHKILYQDMLYHKFTVKEMLIGFCFGFFYSFSLFHKNGVTSYKNYTIRQDKNSIYKVRRYKSHKYHKYSDHFCRQFNLSFIHTSLFNYHFANFQKITLRLLTSFAIQRQCIFSIFLSVFTFLSIVRLWNFPRSFSNTVKSGI